MDALSPVGDVDRYIVCVDDDLDFLKSLEFFLPEEINRGASPEGRYRFLFLNDPREALDALGDLRRANETVALIISDEKMPHMTGTRFFGETKRIFGDAVRVLLTGHAGLEPAIRAINDRLLDKYLTKPIEDQHDFTVTIRHLLDRYQMQLVIAEQNRTIQLKVRQLSEANAVLREQIDMTKQTEQALEKSEEQLRQSLKMDALGRLAGGVAHDFNNILTTIIGRSELAMKRLPKGDVVRSSIEEIQRSAGRAADLTRQLLAFSRKQILEPKKIDLNAVVDNMEKMLRRLIGEDIEFVTVKAPDLGTIQGDPGQIDQVIMNLLINARDAMPNGGKLTIETANVRLDEVYTRNHAEVQPGEYVLLAVSDTGCGIDDVTRDRIFEPFFTTKGKDKGTGLGLSTVYGIVKQSRGHIWIYSEVGHGSSFKIYLPRVHGVVENTPKPAEPTGSCRGSEVVLLVEDERDLRELAREILADAGYEVLDAGNGEDAVRIRQRYEGPIHLMVSDIVMPHMNGPEIYERIAPVCPGLRVLFMSGYTDSAIVENGALEHGVPFLQKPFTPEGLVRKVREILDAPLAAGAASLPSSPR